MRHCELCGAQVLGEIGICASCGTAYTADGLQNDLLIGCPEWGALQFDFAGMVNQNDIVRAIQNAWSELESGTSQCLFLGQLARTSIAQGRFTLYGQRESFVRIVADLQNLTDVNAIVTFHPMDYDEIYRVRDLQAAK